MRTLPCLLRVVFATAAVSQPLFAQHIMGARDARALRVDSVFRAFDRTDSPGCAVGVYQDGAIQYARGYGMASLEHGVSLSPRSVLDVGSISKQFTAMAMLLLEKDGKLSLDDPVRKLFPEMPAYANGVSWRRALSQTSGLRDLWTVWGQTGRTFAGDTVDALNVIVKSAEPNYTPGERYLYTNSGWILAAQAVYRLTGKSLAEFAEERIFGPLGMRDTRYLADRNAIIPHLAESYGPQRVGFRIARSNYDGAIQGPGGVHTTVEDFGRWLHNYDAATVGGPEVLRTMTTPTLLNSGAPATSGPGMAYGVGVIAGTQRGLRVVSHGGSWGGFRGHFLRFPDQRFAVATFCNLTTSGPDSLAAKVAAVYLGDRMARDTVAAWVAALQQEPRVTMSAAALGAYAGVWRNVARGEVRRTQVRGDTLVAVGEPNTAYVPLGSGRFRAERTEIRFVDAASGGAPTRMQVRTPTDTMTFVRADTAVLNAAALAEYAGDYRSDEAEVTHTWRVEKGQLVAYAGYRRLGVLAPSYKDGFTRSGSVIDIVRDAKGRITGYQVEAGRVRHLRFTRVRP